MASICSFHAHVYAAPSGPLEQVPLALRGLPLARLTAAGGAPLRLEAAFPVTWEQAAQRLEALPRMIFEPDGSFVVSGRHLPRPGPRPSRSGASPPADWHVYGQLSELDFAGQPGLHRVELRGTCPRETLDDLLGCVGWPAAPLVFELVMEGVTLDEANFRQWAAATP